MDRGNHALACAVSVCALLAACTKPHAPFASMDACYAAVENVATNRTMGLLNGATTEAWAVRYDGGAIVCARAENGLFIVGNQIYRREGAGGVEPLWSAACTGHRLCALTRSERTDAIQFDRQ